MGITPKLAEILGLLCSEGCHVIAYSNYWEKERGKLRYRNHKKSERIEFYNKDERLLSHYGFLLFKEFGLHKKELNSEKLTFVRKILLKQ